MATALVLPGTSGNYASAPDSAALSILGDIDIRCYCALDDWTPAALSELVAKYNGGAGQASYKLSVLTAGTLQFVSSANGSTAITSTSTSATGFTDGTAHWVRVTLDVDDGASHNVVKFYTSNDGSAWTQLGTTITNAGTTSIFNSTAALEVGSRAGGTASLAAGKFYRAQVRNNILDDGTGIQFDANFEAVVKTGTRTPSSFTESSANAATVTLNGSAWDWLFSTVTATVAVPLGGVAVAVAATSTVPAAITVDVGALTVTAVAVKTVGAAVAVTLGDVTVVAIATPTVLATAVIALGELTVTLVIVPPSAVIAIALGALYVTMRALVLPGTPGAVGRIGPRTARGRIPATTASGHTAAATLSAAIPSNVTGGSEP